MPTKQSQRESEETSHREDDEARAAERERNDGHPDDLDERAEEARELDRNQVKHDEYQEDVEHELEDLDKYQGPDA